MNNDFGQNRLNENDNNIQNTNINSHNVSINNDANNNVKKENNNSKKILIIIIVSIIATLIVFFRIFIIPKLTLYLKNNSSNSAEQSENISKDYSNIYGNWLSNDGSYFVFNENNTLYWYKTKEDLNDNYFYGNIEILRDGEALDDLDISYDKIIDLAIQSKGKVNIDNIYSIKYMPTYLIIDGVDKTETNIPKDSYWKFLFISIDDNNAQVYNYNTSDKYYLIKE